MPVIWDTIALIMMHCNVFTEDKAHSSCIFNTVPAVDLVTQGVKPSAAMVFT